MLTVTIASNMTKIWNLTAKTLMETAKNDEAVELKSCLFQKSSLLKYT